MSVNVIHFFLQKRHFKHFIILFLVFIYFFFLVFYAENENKMSFRNGNLFIVQCFLIFFLFFQCKTSKTMIVLIITFK